LLLRAVSNEISIAPKRTLFDFITGLPLALLAWPSFRDWAFQQKWAASVYIGLIICRVSLAAWRRGATKGIALQESGAALKTVMPVIACTRIHVDGAAKGATLPTAQLQRNIETVLSAIVDLVAQALRLPKDVRLSANLMVPMPVVSAVDGASMPGCGIVAYNQGPASPSWTRLIMGDLGAGQAFVSGKVQAVEDTHDPVWCQLLQESRSRCFACFPIRGTNSEVMAVVNVDADRPMVLTRKNAAVLFMEVLAHPLMLLGDLHNAAAPTSGGPQSEDSHADGQSES
jgi:hypothetical protein